MSGSVKSVRPEEVQAFTSKRRPKDYNLVDVRQEWEYEEFHLPGARLVPLPELPERLRELDPAKPTIVYCASGQRSAAAGRLLAGQGFNDVAHIEGGTMSWLGEYAVGTPRMGLKELPPSATPLKALALAYALEDNLGLFYADLAEKAGFSDLEDTLRRLAGFEDGHKARLLKLVERLAPESADPDTLLDMVDVKDIEGGFSAEAFETEHHEDLLSPSGAIQAAMAIEVQALDLYLRAWRLAEDADTRDVLMELAEEEKRHLKVLSGMLGKREESVF